jgi:CDP-diacylglycerol--glycerol-3-phosphate 3-phosphatidyltransferase
VTRARVRGLADPVARRLGRLGLTPNHLTLIGFGLALLSAAAAAGQQWLLAGVLVLFGGAFDLLDGALARATGRVSRFGAFMDSVFDRWGEGVIYVGIAWGCVAAGFGEGAILAAAALSAAVMVSYIRAKSEGLGFTSGTGMASVGLAPREVRIVILAAGLVLAGVGGGVGGRSAGLAFTLGLIAFLATITTIQRIVHVLNQSRGDANS